MSNEQQVSTPAITRHGSVTVKSEGEIVIKDFTFDCGTSATQGPGVLDCGMAAAKWAIEMLQREIALLDPQHWRHDTRLPLGNIKGYDARN